MADAHERDVFRAVEQRRRLRRHHRVVPRPQRDDRRVAPRTGGAELRQPRVARPQLRQRDAGHHVGVHAAVMGGADGDEPADLPSAVPAQVGARDEPAHAVADDHDLPRAGRFEDRVDLGGGLVGEDIDRGERRAVRQRVDRADAARREIFFHRQPDAGVAQDAMQQEHRRSGRRGRRVGEQPSVENHARNGTRDRQQFPAVQAQEAGKTDAGLGRSGGAKQPRQRHPDQRE